MHNAHDQAPNWRKQRDSKDRCCHLSFDFPPHWLMSIYLQYESATRKNNEEHKTRAHSTWKYPKSESEYLVAKS